MSVIPQLLNTLRTNDIQLRLEGGCLECDAPKGRLSPALLEKLRAHKPELIAFLRENSDGAGHESIPRRDRQDDIPASFGQQRIWFINRISEDKSVFNLPVLTWKVTGRFSVETLKQALEQLVGRHSILRSNYTLIDGQPHFSIRDGTDLEFLLLDLAGLDAEAVDRALEESIDVSTGTPFDLERAPLLRVFVMRLGDNSHVVQATAHHIVFDGWSIEVFTNELVRLYHALNSGAEAALPTLPIQYSDYALWQRERLSGDTLEQDLGYWRDQLQGLTPVLALPLDRARPALQTFHGAVHPFELNAGLTEGLKCLSREAGVTLFMTLFAAYAVLLYRYSGQDDIAVGVPIANRNRRETEGLIGFFVNTVVMRVNTDAEPNFLELLQRVQRMAQDAYAHQDTPFEKVVEVLAPERDRSYSPLFVTSFILQTMEVTEKQALGDLSVETLMSASNTAGAVSDLTLSMVETNGKLVGNLEYNADLFDAETVERMVRHYTTLVEEVLCDAGRSIDALPLLNEAERHELVYQWNDTEVAAEQSLCLHQLFELQAARDPEATALVFGDDSLSYGELNVRANCLALQLREQGVGPEILVGVCLERSPEMVVALLAVLKAGGAYVPMDPDYPRERLEYMQQDAQIRILLTDSTLQERIGLSAPLVVHVDALPDGSDVANPEIAVHPLNLAYVIYTSGSTGRPKGAMLANAGAVNLATRQGAAFAMSPQKRTLQFSSFSFDAAVSEIFTSFAYGAAIVLMKKETLRQASMLVGLLEKSKTTTVTLPPSLLAYLDISRLPQLDTIVLAGEKSNADLARSLCTRARQVLNAYGPTETSVCACLGPVSEQVSDVITIGKPLDNMRLYVLDRLHNPTPIDVPGELYIAGIGVGRGYWQRPGLTAERFLPNPWGVEPGDRMYRTGDLARFRPDGTLEFLGRIDHQVKLRGFRIELGEVEAVLAKHPAVREAVVTTTEAGGRGRELVAYVVGNQPGELDADALRNYVCAGLPDYMVPAAVIVLERLPVTPNGKVDRRALPAPVYRSSAGNEVDGGAARNAVEEQLCSIWAELLGVEQVGIYDNFFDLGGHSLLALKLVSMIEQRLGANVDPGRFFHAPTVAGTARLLAPENSSATAQENVVRLSEDNGQSPLFCMHQASGLVSCYQTLARMLSPYMTVYGITPLTPEQEQGQTMTLELAAEHYADCLRKVQPEGSISLLGWSFGAVVAHAVAQALLNRGREVERLCLIDPTELPQHDAVAPSDVDMLLIFLHQLFEQNGLCPDADSIDLDRLRAMAPAQLLDHCAALAKQHLGMGENSFNGLFSVFSRNLSWLNEYRPSTDLRCHIELFRSSRANSTGDRSQAQTSWEQRAHNTTITLVDAGHFDLLEGASADRIMRQILKI